MCDSSIRTFVPHKHIGYLFWHSCAGYFEGSVIPVNQPRLVTGGLMRSYQLDGMEWLKVRRTTCIVAEDITLTHPCLFAPPLAVSLREWCERYPWRRDGSRQDTAVHSVHRLPDRARGQRSIFGCRPPLYHS